MKLHEYNFRDINRQIVEIKGNEVIKQIHSMNIKIEGLEGGIFYVYIDYEQGIMFELLALVLDNGQYRIAPKEYSYKLKCHPLLETEIDIVSKINLDLFKEKLELVNETYKVSKEIEELRYLKDLDASRHSEYPDDIRVYLLQKEKEPEACWVRVTGIDARKITGKLLTKPMQDIDLEVGEIIEFGTVNMEDGSISCVSVIE